MELNVSKMGETSRYHRHEDVYSRSLGLQGFVPCGLMCLWSGWSHTLCTSKLVSWHQNTSPYILNLHTVTFLFRNVCFKVAAYTSVWRLPNIVNFMFIANIVLLFVHWKTVSRMHNAMATVIQLMCKGLSSLTTLPCMALISDHSGGK